MYTILTDTSANLPTPLLREQNILTLPFTFYANGQDHTCTDTTIFDDQAYYQAIAEGMRVSTSQITPQTYTDIMQPILEQGSDLLFIGMSSGISGSFASARIAAEQLRQEYTQDIILIDSLGASLGEGLLVLYAARCRAQGMTIAQTAAEIQNRRHFMCQVFTVDDLAYLRATGRLSSIRAAVGTLLKIKPILKGDAEGKIVSFARAKGRRQALHALAEQYESLAIEPQNQTIGIAHAGCPEDAAWLTERLRRNKPPRDILTVAYEPVTGAHVGPGAIALFFLGDPMFRRT